jgi:GT2 family glycosyltransferase
VDAGDETLSLPPRRRTAMEPAVVAIPVRNEVERIERCLRALAEQTRSPDAVVLLLNNCTDGTADVVQTIGRQLPFPLNIVSVSLAPARANAGNARRLAMFRAAELAGQSGTLLTTDADAIVAPDWISRNLAGLAAGAHAICGRVVVDPVEASSIPDNLHADDLLECQLLDLLDEIAFMLDPDPHDPRPRHTQASGASIAVPAAMLQKVGGIPPLASGEDRAFIDALIRVDARVRHDPDIAVVASARLDGRARGGMADTIKRRMRQQDVYTDSLAEPAADKFRRMDFRRRARRVWRESEGRSYTAELAADLGLEHDRLVRLLSARHFGTAWAGVERETPLLPRRKVRFADLPRQIAIARQLLIPNAMPTDPANTAPIVSRAAHS